MYVDVVRNQVGLDAEAIFNEVDNNVLRGLEIATREIVSAFYFAKNRHRCSRLCSYPLFLFQQIIEILNGTYPPQRRLVEFDEQTGFENDADSRIVEDIHSLTVTKSDERQVVTNPTQVSLRGSHKQQHPLRDFRYLFAQRRLAYYTDDIPVAINSVTDNPLCAGSAQNPRIMCAIVSSTVCVVLEEGDDPTEVRALLIAGLRQAVDSGDFLRRIPPQDLTMDGDST